MNKIITAVYENGVFKPDSPLDLPTATRVRLIVDPLPNNPVTDEDPDDEAWREFERLSEEMSINLRGEHWTRDQYYDRR